jgi:hypothetical protein
MNRTTTNLCGSSFGRWPSCGLAASAGQPEKSESKRILGIVPNYRTFPTLDNFTPLTAGQKFKEASEDAFDRRTFALGGIFGGVSQLTNSNRRAVDQQNSTGERPSGFAAASPAKPQPTRTTTGLCPFIDASLPWRPSLVAPGHAASDFGWTFAVKACIWMLPFRTTNVSLASS